MNHNLGTFKDQEGNEWSAVLETRGNEEPLVHLAAKNCTHGAYPLGSFLAVTCRRESPFVVSSTWGDGPVWPIAAEAARTIAQGAMAYVLPSHGTYVVLWVPDDPRVPF